MKTRTGFVSNSSSSSFLLSIDSPEITPVSLLSWFDNTFKANKIANSTKPTPTSGSVFHENVSFKFPSSSYRAYDLTVSVKELIRFANLFSDVGPLESSEVHSILSEDVSSCVRALLQKPQLSGIPVDLIPAYKRAIGLDRSQDPAQQYLYAYKQLYRNGFRRANEQETPHDLIVGLTTYIASVIDAEQTKLATEYLINTYLDTFISTMYEDKKLYHFFLESDSFPGDTEAILSCDSLRPHVITFM